MQSEQEENDEFELDAVLEEMINSKKNIILFRNKFKNANKSDLKKYLEAILNPKTPEQWKVALTDPNSPQYKLLMQLIEEGIAEELMLMKFLQTWIEVVAREEKKLKEQELKEHIVASYLIERKLHDYLLRLSASIIKKVETNTSLDQLKKLIVQLPAKIAALQQKTTAIQNNIAILQNKKALINQNWQRRNQDFDNVLVQGLRAEKLRDPDLKVFAVVENQLQEISVDQFETIVKHAPQAVTFDEKLQHNPGLKEKLLDLWKSSKETATVAAKMENVFDQLNKFAHMCGTMPLIKFINANKKLNKIMGEISNNKTELNAKDINDLLSLTEVLMAEEEKLSCANDMIHEMEKLLKTAEERVIDIEKEGFEKNPINKN